VPERGSVLINLDKPVIAMVNGGAYGHGCDIAFYCDIITASRENAQFQWTYIHRGMVPAEGGTYFLPRIAGKYRALEALWLGTSMSADQCYEWGWINHVWPDAELKERTYDLARRLAEECPPMIMGAIKYCVHAGFPGGDFGFGLLKHLDELVGPATRAFEGSEDAIEGPRSFVEKRKPKYTGR
jgi:enoyl-CoA hydratase/carnithine racemase